MLFDRYQLYSEAVQAPYDDAKFLRALYREINHHQAVILREDFCGAHSLAQAWVELAADNLAFAIDIDPEALDYGAQRCRREISPQQLKRLKVTCGDVLHSRLGRADIACAFNFSYFCFHSRATLLSYFKRARSSLNPKGIFVVDLFGGPECEEPASDTRRLKGFKYTFEQEYFDPIQRRARFHIHFQPSGKRMRKRVFSYDWRMWSIPEVRDVMVDAGFKETRVYWEGTGRNGRGSGRYHRRERGESCRVWTAYVVGMG